MKNIKKKILFALTIFGLFALSFQLSVSAESVVNYYYQAIDSSPDTWITQKERDYEHHYDEASGNYIGNYTYYRYKMVVPENVYVVFEWVNIENVYNYIDAYQRVDATSYDDRVFGVGGSECKAEKRLPAGTYYLEGESNKVFRYSFRSYKNESNYKLSKAKSLKAGQEIIVVQSKGANYSRWYKIKLTKKQTIKFWTGSQYNIALYNSKHRRIRNTVEAKTGEYYTYKSQKKGTYYVRIKRADHYSLFSNPYDQIIHFKWK